MRGGRTWAVLGGVAALLSCMCGVLWAVLAWNDFSCKRAPSGCTMWDRPIDEATMPPLAAIAIGLAMLSIVLLVLGRKRMRANVQPQ